MNDVERIARILCKMDNVDPDRRSFGIGRVIPKDQEYSLWEARRRHAEAILEHYAPIDRSTDASIQIREYSGELARFYREDGKWKFEISANVEPTEAAEKFVEHMNFLLDQRKENA